MIDLSMRRQIKEGNTVARIHKISGYLVDANGYYSGDDIKIQLEEKGLDLISQHLHIETVDIGEWEDSNPLNF